MYEYDARDTQVVQERVDQFRDQVRRRLSDELTEDEFRPLRLMNGLYNQRHAYMLRVAIPYGLLNAKQVRMLGHIARTYDRDYGHFTTRQNIQFNWPELEDVPDILQHLADVEMHAIQTSGNCVRNISADHLAGVARDEVADPRPYCEIMRQWSSFHPEFSYLPRKFKLAFTGATADRAAIRFHDIGYRLLKNDAGELGFEVIVGGGMGRTPIIGAVICDFLPERDLLSYTESILRVYNRMGNRENKYKARIKILVKTLGIDEFRRLVDADWAEARDPELELTPEKVAHFTTFFAPPAYDLGAADYAAELAAKAKADLQFERWMATNVLPHKQPGYHAVVVSVKAADAAPGDATGAQLDGLADIADAHAFGELRVLHTQNALFAHVSSADLYKVWQRLRILKLATPNIDLLTDQICCPGLDFCSLANAGSLNVAQDINDAFDDLDYLYDLGELKLKMSGCINACGHHHVGHIGILGISKRGEEYYQIMLGGSETDDASLGRILGRAVPQAEVVPVLKAVIDVFVEGRQDGERFLDMVRRVGFTPFKERAYVS
ncbi:MAG: sulfite reductase (NADPH) hemoprotein beta-component [Bradymonadia bacterium]|jgi:sulfite reductase (NADPH) hemoprotein beta-component